MNWDEFCKELAKELEIDEKFISHEIYTATDGFSIVRFHFFKDKPFHFDSTIQNEKSLCNTETAYRLAKPLRHYAVKAIENRLPKNNIMHFTF